MLPKDILYFKRTLRALEKVGRGIPELEDMMQNIRKGIQDLEAQEQKDAMTFIKDTIDTILENGDNGRRCLKTINFHFRKENKDPETTDLGELEGHYAYLRDDDYKKFEEDLRRREEKAAEQ